MSYLTVERFYFNWFLFIYSFYFQIVGFMLLNLVVLRLLIPFLKDLINIKSLHCFWKKTERLILHKMVQLTICISTEQMLFLDHSSLLSFFYHLSAILSPSNCHLCEAAERRQSLVFHGICCMKTIQGSSWFWLYPCGFLSPVLR